MSKRMGKHGRGNIPFVQIFRYMMDSPAWRDLSPTARALYLELKKLYNGKNNGTLAFGARDAGAALNLGKSSASRYFRELEDHGFIVKEQLSSFHQKRMAIEWRLTELKNDVTGELATKEFTNWGKVSPSKDGTKNQKPVPLTRAIGRSAGLEHVSAAEARSSSPAYRPANHELVASQAQERATSTILPGGTPKKSTTKPAVPAHTMAEADARLSAAPSVAKAISADSESRKGTAIVAPTSSNHFPWVGGYSRAAEYDDPMIAAILATFPGVVVVSHSVRDVTQDLHAVELPLWIQDDFNGDILDVVPHGFEREFWMESS